MSSETLFQDSVLNIKTIYSLCHIGIVGKNKIAFGTKLVLDYRSFLTIHNKKHVKGSHDQVILSKLANTEVKIICALGIWLSIYNFKDRS